MALEIFRHLTHLFDVCFALVMAENALKSSNFNVEMTWDVSSLAITDTQWLDKCSFAEGHPVKTVFSSQWSKSCKTKNTVY